ncbi:MAG TPA: hypothetical protein VF572_02635 [Candidatus Saccharimonadales bacterium]|jgi:hypothetical protein
MNYDKFPRSDEAADVTEEAQFTSDHAGSEKPMLFEFDLDIDPQSVQSEHSTRAQHDGSLWDDDVTYITSAIPKWINPDGTIEY